MDVDDRVVLTTPEGVTIELTLAGLGSRFTAGLADVVVRGVITLAVALAAGLIGVHSVGWITALGVLAIFLLTFGYDVLFELLAGGRTPGKRMCGIRVVDANGGPVRFLPSVVRNLVRLVDILPGFYLVGMITVLISKRNQRLGDIVARTLVIRERRTPPPVAWRTPEVTQAPVTWDVAQVTPDELATVRRFLERRSELLPHARKRLARDLAEHLRAKVAGIDEGGGDEQFLELIVSAKATTR